MRNGLLVQIARCSAAPWRPNNHIRAGIGGHARRWQSVSSAKPATPNAGAAHEFGARKWSTPLAKILADAIEATGPISIASYMRQCLTNPEHGYYTTRSRSATQDADADQFGRRGDFITSPEISQIFGELIGVWFLTEWMAQGRRKIGVQIIELGPGRGTLMDDILRTLSQFKTFAGAVECVWMVEAGEMLRERQRGVLCGADKEMKWDAEKGWWEARSKYAGIPVRWVEDIALVLKDEAKETMPFVVAHEFFDALPIHAFEVVAPKDEEEQSKAQLLAADETTMVRRSGASKVPQWRELLVAPTRQKFSIETVQEQEQRMKNEKPEAEFQLSIAKASTPTSLVLPERPRYRKLKNQPGSRVEISPESYRYVEDIARRIGGFGKEGKQSGAGLIIDYGPADTVPIDSLRGIKAHQIISPFAAPGEADISADVDFTALADAAIDASQGVEIHGPVEQGVWLSQLGIKERAEQLLKSLGRDGTEAKRTEIETGWKRLVEGGPKGMGKAYKCLAILPEAGGKRRPVGFGGGVV